MSEVSERSSLPKNITLVVTVALSVKLLWGAVEALFLPLSGVDKTTTRRVGSLPHSYRLASNEVLPRPIKTSPVTRQGSIRDLRLLATYQSPNRSLAVIHKGSKSYVLSIGDEIFGYRVTDILERTVLLNRDGKEYQIEIMTESPQKSSGTQTPHHVQRPIKPSALPSSIRREGETTVIPRQLVNEYTRNIDKIWKEIGVTPQKKGGKLQGFRVRYLKRNSIFEKLGLRRGDIITAVNGEAIEDYSTPMEIFQSVDSLEGLTLTVKRGKHEVELEYEIQ